MTVSNPKCCMCRKGLVWDLTKRATVRGATGWRRRHAMLRKERGKLAIRCLWCLHTFCPKCAVKHFAPIERTQRAVDKILERMATGVLKAALKGQHR